MAQINIQTFNKIEKGHNSIHEKVFATYSIFDKDGEIYVQIDTYGKSDREIPGKVSQSIQFDEESAKLMVDILKKAFKIS